MRRLTLVIKLASSGIFTNKVRSILTVLGIVIGIAAVIALLSLGQGAQSAVTESISSLGSNLITVFPGTNFRQGPGSDVDARLTKRDYDYLRNNNRFPNINLISPYSSGFLTANIDSNEISAEIKGVDYNFNEIQDLQLLAGNFFSEADVDSSRNVAVIGSDILTELFPGELATEVIGEEVSLKQLNFRVIGVLSERGGSAFANSDDDIFTPYTSANDRLFNRDFFNAIYMSVNDTELIDATVLQIEERLTEFRGNNPEDIDFTVFTSDDILATASTVTSIFTTLLSSIAAISLIVGGIGISNIMLVSVTERTREIGLRKAIGARESDILLQFLTEAVLLTLIGGLLGILIGVLLAFGIGAATNIQANLTIEVVLLATLFSALIGIIFGFFPALNAARLNPIDALRYE